MKLCVIVSAWIFDLAESSVSPLFPLCENAEGTRPCFSPMDNFPVMVLHKKEKKKRKKVKSQA